MQHSEEENSQWEKNQKWQSRLLSIAHLVASWSKDPSVQCGAVIVDSKRRLVGTGYNGFPRGVDDFESRYADRPQKLLMIVHAEANAILNAVKSVEGCTIYVTAPPCNECAKLIIQSGIRTVVSAPASKEFASRWVNAIDTTRTMFIEANVEWITIGG